MNNISDQDWEKLTKDYKHLWPRYIGPLEMTKFINYLYHLGDNGRALKEFIAWLDKLYKKDND